MYIFRNRVALTLISSFSSASPNSCNLVVLEGGSDNSDSTALVANGRSYYNGDIHYVQIYNGHTEIMLNAIKYGIH